MRSLMHLISFPGFLLLNRDDVPAFDGRVSACRGDREIGLDRRGIATTSRECSRRANYRILSKSSLVKDSNSVGPLLLDEGCSYLLRTSTFW